MAQVTPLYKDPFSPVLFRSTPLLVSDEQKSLVKDVLDISSSDSRFAEKAYVAITRILTAPVSLLPLLTSLNPTSATLGSPSFTLHVIGSGFDSLSKIVWNGSVEPTTYVSATELTTGVDMSTAQVAMDIPVMVQNSNGVLSNSLKFALTSPVQHAVKSVPSVPSKEEVKK